jgi:hypothetical protein
MSTKLLVSSAIVIGLVLAAAKATVAQDPFGRATLMDERSQGSDYGHTTYAPTTSYQPNVEALIHQRAQERAAQRQMRLAALNWYGMSNSRPTASPTPFSSLYSPVWQMPGGRPFAWFPITHSSFPYYVR